MSENLPNLTLSDFRSRLVNSLPDNHAGILDATTLQLLFNHYNTLRQWNKLVSLVGPGTCAEVVERHYGESLAGLAFLPETARVLADLGSGAGFPGFVLSAARPDLQVTLIEPQQRKWAFLKTACRQASLSCYPLNARVGADLPEGLPRSIDLVTVRALRLTSTMIRALRPRLATNGAILLWGGTHLPSLPEDLIETGSIPILTSKRRRIIRLEFVNS